MSGQSGWFGMIPSSLNRSVTGFRSLTSPATSLRDGFAQPVSLSANFLTVSRVGIGCSCRASTGRHGAKRDRIARQFDGRNAVLPNVPRRPRHHVEGTGLRIECKTLPLRPCLSTEPKFAGRCERKPEHLGKMRFVAVPADTHPNVIFRAEHLPDRGNRQFPEIGNPRNEGVEPGRKIVGLCELLLRIIIPPAEG